MLAQLAATIRRRRAEGGGTEEGEDIEIGGAGGRIVLSDDCIVM